MPSPDETRGPLPAPSPALVLDASGTGTFAGIIGKDGTWTVKRESDGSALENLFPLAGEVFREAGHGPEGVAAFIYCSGPGSVLGIRLCGMAIETWRRLQPAPVPLLHYSSLRLAALLLTSGELAGADALLVSELKKDAWNALPIRAGQPGEETVLTDGTLSANALPLYHLPRRKGWGAPPGDAIRIRYQPVRLPDVLPLAGLLSPAESLILPESGTNTFRKWVPERHR